MGRYDDITPDQARAELLRFAELIRRMDQDEVLLRSTPRLLKMLGELRQMLFAYEIRGARHLGGKDLPGSSAGGDAAPAPDDASLRVVREALQREKELQEELERRLLEREDRESEQD